MLRKVVFIIVILPSLCLAQLSNVTNLWVEYESKADGLYEKNLYSKALDQYLVSIDKGNQNPLVFLKAGRCFYKLRQYDKAAEFLETPVANNTGDVIYQNEDVLWYAESLLATGKSQEAKIFFSQYYNITSDRSSKNRIEGIEAQDNFFLDSDDIQVELLKLSSKSSEIGLTGFNNGLIFSSKADFSWPVDNDYLMGDQETYGLYFAEYKKDSAHLRRPRPIEVNRSYFNITTPVFQGDSIVIFSANKKKLIKPKSGNQLKLFKATVKGAFEWVFIKEMDINFPDASAMNPSFSESGDTLYFASNSPQGKGGFDIYYSIFKRGFWNKPVNAGEPVNTEGDELYPLVKNGTLYFSSNGHPGLGGLDVFLLDKKSNDVKNYGYPVNTPYDDFNMIFKPGHINQGYLVSNRPKGEGKDDIYSFISNKKERATIDLIVMDKWENNSLADVDISIMQPSGKRSSFKTNEEGKIRVSISVTDTLYLSVKKDPYYDVTDTVLITDIFNVDTIKMSRDYLLKGIVQSSDNYQGISNPNIFITDLATNEHFDIKGNDNGYFELTRTAGTRLSLEVSRQNFDYSVDTVLFADPVNTATILLRRVEKYETITLNDILYEFDQFELSDDQIPTLDSLANIMKRLPTVHILVVAHTDSKGESRYNFELSQKRAESVSNYLMRQGIDRKRIVSEGRGEAEPLNDCIDGVECNEEEYRVNRRTEIFVFYDES